ncbi:MarR family winged helix-turn-helix transcriptional regulator [Sediminitomix flava]|uniref:DNA-binding MarR family transcriptional regulator n=1 Tax=Sediminitomix flava TaxID=379075 RepID=A0A315YXV5_SEDFL|nr:MarR family transcriptional regulator [Sediminitomix flava]PWJ34132.1 DNA-binding MarR family transcriptional regulator [Sediminitomix flava]
MKEGEDKNDLMKLDNQLCFPLYAASRLMTRLYQPLLETLGLTYPQYLVMLILWEEDGVAVKEIGAKLLLNSNTLTPLLKRLQEMGLVERKRQKEDERVVCIFLTEAGKKMREQASCIPQELVQATKMDLEEALRLKADLENLIDKIK